jgi:methionyl-tRNA formyltransferase
MIDPRSTPLHEVYAKYRGFYLWPKIYFVFKDKRVIVEELILDGNIYKNTKDIPLLDKNTLNPAVITIKLKPEGKRTLEWKEFLNGYLK